MYPKLLSYALALAVCVPLLAGCDSDDDGDDDGARTFTVTVENVGPMNPVLKSGAVAQTDDGTDPPIEPGASVSFSFTAPANTVPMSGMRFNMATMFVQSNDLFYAFRPEGLDLFPGGTPRGANGVAEDVTDQIFLYDAGTEINEVPGQGQFQKLVQDPMATNVGPDENGVVTLIDDDGTDDTGFDYPDKEDVIRVTIAHNAATSTFTVTVSNVSVPGLIPDTDLAMGAVPLSPFAWAAHVGSYRMYEVGQPASDGIRLIAEDGFPAAMLGGMPTAITRGLADELADVTGRTVPLSPGAYAVHDDDFEWFTNGEEAPMGIEAIAEDGNPMPAGAALAADDDVSVSGTFVRGVGATMDGAIPPGGSFRFSFDAEPGDRLSLATMYVQSNDLYYAFSPDGLDLFPNGSAVRGDVTGSLSLYDAGTEGDEEPGVGPNQVIRQPAPNTGPDGEGTNVSIGDGGTNDGFSYPANADIIRVTISSQ